MGFDCFLVALPPVRDLSLSAKHLFLAAKARRQISLQGRGDRKLPLILRPDQRALSGLSLEKVAD
jgi:hypothetical protein